MRLGSVFGFKFRKNKNTENQKVITPITTVNDGGITIDSSSYFYYSRDGQSGVDIIANEVDLINRYRIMANNPDVSNAVDEICDEAIIVDNGVVSLNLDAIAEDILPKNSKEIIIEEFNKVLTAMDFNINAYNLFRQFYIDGRIYMHAMIDVDNPTQGVKKFKLIDPRQIIKVKETIETTDDKGTIITEDGEEYFIYNKDGIDSGTLSGEQISKDSIAYAFSGIVDNNGCVLSDLHKAIKPLNQLTLVEDSSVVYRLARASEKRVFYVDCGRLNYKQAEEYVTKLMNNHNNKIQYNSETGEIENDKKFISMLEDYWLPRINGKSTEIQSLDGGASLGEIDDILYFQKKFLKSLKVPTSRLESDSSIGLGRTSEINRDELKFSKFVQRKLVKFSDLLRTALRIELLSTNTISVEDWDKIENLIEFDWKKDSYFSELKNMEILRERISAVNDIQDYVGQYFSKEYVQKNILNMSDEEIDIMNKQIETEKSKNIIPNEDEEEDNNF